MLILTISDMRTMPGHQRSSVGCVRRIEAARTTPGLSPRPATSPTATPRPRFGAPRLASSAEKGEEYGTDYTEQDGFKGQGGA